MNDQSIALAVGQGVGIDALDAEFIKQQPAAERGNREVRFHIGCREQFDDALGVRRAARAGDAENDWERLQVSPLTFGVAR